MSTVSIIVPYFNLPEFLDRLLGALLEQTYPHRLIEIIIVDDGSASPAAPIIAKARQAFEPFMALRLVTHTSNRGRAAARNSGIRAAQGDILAFIDVDDLPAADYIQNIVDVHTHQRHVAVRSNIRVLPQLRSTSAFLRYRDSRFIGARKHTGRRRIDLENLPPNFFATSGASISRADLLTVGFFNEAFWGYGGEDEEMGFRLFLHGVRIVFRAECRVWDGDHTTTLERTQARYRDYGANAARVLFTECPAYRKFSRLSKLEPIERGSDRPLVIMQKVLLRAIVSARIGRFIGRVLSRIDRCRLWTDPPGFLYQYVLLASYAEGVRARKAATQENQSMANA